MVFSPAFFGTALCCVVLAVFSFFRWDKPDAIYLLAGSLLYLVGTILVTIIFNVPLNDALAAVDPTTDHAGHLWATYVKSWTAWNHVRTGIGARGSGFVYRRALSCELTIRSHPTQSLAANDAHNVARSKPEDWPRVFEQHLNGGDLDAVMACVRTGSSLRDAGLARHWSGRDAIREVLAGMIAAKTQFRSRVARAVTVGDIAQFVHRL